MTINFSQDVRRDMLEQCEELLDAFRTASIDLFEQMDTICNGMQYFPFIEMTNECIDDYNETWAEMDGTLQMWLASDDAIAAAIDKLVPDKKTEKEAERFEADLVDVWKNSNQLAAPINADSARPNINDAWFNSMEEAVSDYQNRLDVITESTNERIQASVDENILYEAISALFIQTTNIISALATNINDRATDRINHTKELINKIRRN